MTKVLPKRHEAQQLCKLRGLRVQRAREAVVLAQAEVDRAAEKVKERQRKIEHLRDSLDKLQKAMVTSLVPVLPRWSSVARAQREKLADRLARDEYALIEDERNLEAAQEKLQAARAEVTRALAREDAVRGLANETKRAHALRREQRAELEIEDQGRPSGMHG
jgi:chromosome segregation ATPase